MAGTMIQQHLQLFSHLEGDALNVAHLVPLARRLSRSGLVDALTAHYGSPGRLADCRRQFERTTRKVGEDPAIFATALEALAVKAFGDMGQTARLRLIRDIFIAGHDNCDLRRHLDSVPPETPIRDVVDRCRVWESHADPIVHRMNKPTPDMTYPTYAVSDTDKDREVIKVAAVTGLRSDQNQLQDLLRWIVSAVERPAPTPEIDIEKLLLQLARVPPDGPAPVVDTPVPPTLEQMLRSVLDGQRRRQRQPQRQRQPPKQRPVRRDWSDVMCFSCGKMGHAATRCLDYNDSISATWMAEGKDAGGFHYDSSAGGNGPPTSGKRRLNRGGGGGGAYPSGQGSCSARDPGGGAVSTVSPQRTITDDAFQTVEQSGGVPCLSSPGAWTECTERTMAEDIQRQECPHDDDLEIQPRTDTIRISEDGVPVRNIVSPYGEGVRSLPGATATPVPPADGPQVGSLAGGSGSGRRDPRGRCFRSGISLC